MASNVIEVIAKGKDLVSGPMSKMAKGVTRSITGIAKSVFSLRGAFATLAGTAGVGLLVKSFVESASLMEDFRTRLISITKSSEVAEQKLKSLSDFAAKSPFELAGVIEAGVTLEAFGAKAEQTIAPLGDLAAFMGIDIVEAAGAFGRAFAAGAGAADILRERGVLTLIKLQTGIQDLTTLTLPEFRKAMLQAMTDPDGKIFGATERLAQTFTGQVSQMSDAILQLKIAVGDALLPTMKDLVTNHIVPIINKTKDWAKANQELIQIKFRDFIIGIINSLKALSGAIDKVLIITNTVNAAWKALEAVFFSAAKVLAETVLIIAKMFEASARITDALGITSGAVKNWTGLIIGAKRASEDFSKKTVSSLEEMSSSASKALGDTEKDFDKLINSIKNFKSETDTITAPSVPSALGAGEIDVGTPQLTKQETAEIDKLMKKALELDQLKSDLFAADVERLAVRLEETKATEQQILEFIQASDLLKNELLDAEALKRAGLQVKLLEGTEEGFAAELELITLQNEQKLALAEQFGISIEGVEASIAKKKEERERKQLIKNLNTAAKFASLTGQLSANLNQLLVEQGEEKNKALFVIEKAAAIATAIINTAVGVTQALALPFPLSFTVAGLTAAVGATEIALIAATAFAQGGIVNKATLGLLGEEGPEAIIPLNSPAAANLGIGPSAGNIGLDSGGDTIIQNVEMFPNVTEGDVLFSLPDTTLERWVTNKLFVTFDSLSRRGIIPEFAE